MGRGLDFPKLKTQAAMDFMVSYGVIVIVVAVLLTILYSLQVFTPKTTPSYCTPIQSSFSCTAYSLTANGILSIELSQSVGGYINITGVSCSTAINGTGSAPRYGNIGVTGNTVYYPPNGFTKGTILFGSTAKRINLYCYGPGAAVPDNGIVGTQFIGYVWLNYTNPGLPAGYSVVEPVFTVSTAYT